MHLDHATSPDPNSPGLLEKTRFSSIWKVFSFRPRQFYKNGLYDYWGEKLDSGCVGSCEPLVQEENIVGIAAAISSSQLFSKDRFWNQLFPRVFALAQRAFSTAEWDESGEGSWDVFSNDDFLNHFAMFRYGLKFELKALEREGILYHLPKPGVKITDTDVMFNSLYGNSIMIRRVGDNEWENCEDARG